MKELLKRFNNTLLMYSVAKYLVFLLRLTLFFCSIFFQISKVETVTAAKPSNRLTKFLIDKNIIRII